MFVDGVDVPQGRVVMGVKRIPSIVDLLSLPFFVSLHGASDAAEQLFFLIVGRYDDSMEYELGWAR